MCYTYDSVRVCYFLVLDGDVEVGPHDNSGLRREVFEELIQGGFSHQMLMYDRMFPIKSNLNLRR